METATIALIVSIASATLTLGGLVWQLALYRLSGARLRVELVFEYRGEDNSVFSSTGTPRVEWDAMSIHLDHEMDAFGIERARVRVTNIGRSPVSIEDLTLDVGRFRGRRNLRKSFTPKAFRDHESSDPEVQNPTKGPIRLEAGSTASRVFYLWPSVRDRIEREGGKLVLRGSATAAGRHPTLSRRGVAWRFKTGDNSWFVDREVTPGLRVFRELWKHSYHDELGMLPLDVHSEVTAKLAAGASREDIAGYLQGVLGDKRFVVEAAYGAHRAFHAEDGGNRRIQ